MRNIFQLPFEVLWRFILVRLDRLVPIQALRITSNPPYPVKVKLPSRGKHKIPTYLFVPDGLNLDKDDPIPVHIDFHGGGFFMGSCMEQAPFCSMIAATLNRIVISVDYRMGPLHRFPAAIEDAEDVVSAVLHPTSPGGSKLRQHISKKLFQQPVPSTGEPTTSDILDPSRISLSGFSSGGNIALNLALHIETDDLDWSSPLSRDSPHPIPALLFYPAFDQSCLPHERPPPSHLPPEKQSAIMNPGRLKLATYLSPTYLSAEHRTHLRACPGNIDVKCLHPEARLFLVLPEMDTLATQSEEWVEKVRREGKGDVLQVRRCPGMRHGWTQFPDIALSKGERREKVETFIEALRFLERF
ncbi:Alpha/beta hydrolase fold-containing protein 8 [Elsinoe fawcettii]|nr:Alpha/beta hydrolase fold-containing protein 8 [Elsinoe fawcettii]